MPGKPKGKLTAIYVLTGQGLAVARRLAATFDARLYVAKSVPVQTHDDTTDTTETPGSPEAHGSPCLCPQSGTAPGCRPLAGHSLRPRRFSRLPELVRLCFQRYDCHIFITAAGIAVRAIAPLLQNKYRDPAVLVVDQRGRFVTSLLSGHPGGANALALKAAAALGATAVISTATDTEDLPALDVLAEEKGLAAASPGAVKAVSSALLAGQRVMLHDPDNYLGIRGGPWEKLFRLEPDPARAMNRAADATRAARSSSSDKSSERYAPLPAKSEASEAPHAIRASRQHTPASAKNEAPEAPRVIVAQRAVLQPPENWLLLHPRLLFAGIGCRKGTTEHDILRHIREALAHSGLPLEAVAALASIEAKQQETGLLRAAQRLNLPLLFFSADELARYPVSLSSGAALKRFGLHGVCEPAALAAAGPGAELLILKTVGERVTLAVARAAQKR